MKLTIFRKGLILLAVPLLFQIALIGLVLRARQDGADAQRWMAHSQAVIAHAHRVLADAADVQTGARGLVITGDPGFAVPYDRAAAALATDLDRLGELVRDNPDQSARAEGLRTTAAAFLEHQAEVVGSVRAGAVERAVARVKAGEGEALVADLRRSTAEFLREEEALDRRRTERLEEARRRVDRLLVGGAVGALLCTGLVAAVFRRGVSGRFATLTDNTRRLAAGEELPPPLTGDDELARLDRAFRDMAADLTAASDRLRESAREVRDLYDNAPCGYHSVGPDGVVVAMNRTELRWLGYDAGEVVGRMVFADVLAPGSRGPYREAFARLREQGEVTGVELELVRRDGTTFPVLASSAALRGPDGRYLKSRTTLTDLTERKRAEDAVRRLNEELEDRVRERTAELARANAALRVEEGRFRSAFDDTNVAMVLTDLDNRFVRANAAFARLFGYTQEEVLGLSMGDVTHPDHLADSYDRRKTLLAGENDFFEMEKRYRHRDGHVLWGLTNVSLVRDPDGRPLMYVGQVQDITERKRAEEAVRERAAELAEANRDLRQKNDENEMFVYSVSHDLRSPLVNLQGFSRELEKGCQSLAALFADAGVPAAVRDQGAALLGGKMARSLGFIQTAVLRLGGIIDSLLRLSRAGRVEYRWEEVDVGRLVAQVLDAMQATVAERGAAVAVGDLPPAWGDRTALEQAFANLLGNALAYLDPDRSGAIEVGCLPPGSAGGAEGYRTFFVRDNGLGIAEGHSQKVFQAFQRAHPGVGTGEGIGLAIVARVAERHRGRAWVESRAGEGSTFFITLPGSAGNTQRGRPT